ncbi:lysine-specific metallo-endopeptidase domain-containing protein [Paramyrothecium foliicola]|nr:lysine-specific metallo-endopeptidase domain-containing protein [Paramyrothecium foliicola]
MLSSSFWILALACLSSLSSQSSVPPSVSKRATSNNVHSLLRREWDIDEDSCGGDKKEILEKELERARDMADKAKDFKTDSPYYKNLISKLHQDLGDGFAGEMRKGFERIHEMLQSDDGAYYTWITCNSNTEFCQDPNYYAHMNDIERHMNFCDRFFSDDSPMRPTEEVLDKCDDIDLRAAHRTRAALIIHECTHTKFAMVDTDLARDYAYGFNGCYQLAQGAFNRDCAPYKKKDPKKESDVLCPDPDDRLKESWCVPELEMKNADTWAFIAAGTYFSKECDKEIPLPELPELPGQSKANRTARRGTAMTKSPKLFTRADECVGFDDYIVIDG